jgi:hypothetical protein
MASNLGGANIKGRFHCKVVFSGGGSAITSQTIVPLGECHCSLPVFRVVTAGEGTAINAILSRGADDDDSLIATFDTDVTTLVYASGTAVDSPGTAASHLETQVTFTAMGALSGLANSFALSHGIATDTASGDFLELFIAVQ